MGFDSDGLGLTPDTPACAAGCTLSDIRFGVNAHFHFAGNEKMQPWIGVGFGVENVNSSSDSGFDSATPGGAIGGNAQLKGIEFLNLQGGLDIAGQTRFFRFGPFVALSVGQFSTAEAGSGTVPITVRRPEDASLLADARGARPI